VILLVALLALAAATSPDADDLVVAPAAELDRVSVTECRGVCRTTVHPLVVDGDRVVAVGRDRLLNGPRWLGALPRPVTVRFDLPAGLRVSSPGTAVAGEPGRYRLGGHPGGWPLVIAFGAFEVRAIELGPSRLEVAVLDADGAPDRDVLMAWITDAALRVMSVYGTFPVPRLQVVVTPVAPRPPKDLDRDADPVPFGRVLRDGGDAVQLFVRRTASPAALARDWTATHEFSHLLLPYVDRSDGWLAEGLATYYQNVLLARSGVYSAREAWQRLVDGFARGRRDDYVDTLTESIARRGPNHLMRMYWSGAAIALLADVALRESGSSLDAVLAGLRTELPSDQAWSAERVIARLDASGGDGRLEALRRRSLETPAFPDVEATLAALGVLGSAGEVLLDESAPLASVRRAIESPARSGAGQ
jgi:hypothetical protein